MSKTIFVTGGAGFIGSAVVRQYILDTDISVVNIDKLTYAGNLESLEPVAKDARYTFEQADICDAVNVTRLFQKYQPAAVMHLAAESHVDRSISGPAAFIETNIVGTYTLLQAAREYWQQMAPSTQGAFRFLHVSTDEVFGSLGEGGYFTETTAYEPSSPYSASKASSDHLVRAWHHTYGFPTLVTNCSNNYGAYQFPEKLIPLMILNGLKGKALPVYGKGNNVRDWLYVDDHARALRLVLEKGVIGETYNIGGGCERANLDVVNEICRLLDELRPNPGAQPHAALIQFVTDRPGHDFRYAIDAAKISRELGWRPLESFESGLRKTVSWYLENPAWVEHVLTGDYQKWLERNYGQRATS